MSAIVDSIQVNLSSNPRPSNAYGMHSEDDRRYNEFAPPFGLGCRRVIPENGLRELKLHANQHC
ncbi:predicted protein [Botrytis cinerea T4]|uniref:Uncharacterized protein n=1 Tax=Botryotinia fuckeliana (strain T4) TaxID=999810 RepID=G2Y8V0_BOTF4|nr:predicted protein [Botrytis cinerea T4]